jgi:hypothetical protein
MRKSLSLSPPSHTYYTNALSLHTDKQKNNIRESMNYQSVTVFGRENAKIAVSRLF